MKKPPFTFFARCLSALALIVGLAACGGDDTPPANTLSGTAAVGAPIVGGTIDVTCAGGNALSTTTGSNGFWTVTTSGQTLPCAVRVSGGTINSVPNTTPYHSIAITLGTVNLTPLTDLVVANLTSNLPATWFAGLNATVLQGISSTAITTAITGLNTQLGTGTALNGMNPLTAAFNAANGDRMDDVLEALQAAVNAWSESGYGGLLTNARYGFSEFGTSFSISFGTQFGLTTTGMGGTGGAGGGGSSGTCSVNEVSLTYSGNTAGTHTNGQQLCFVASTTALTFSGQTLNNPVQNTVVSAPNAAYVFSDTAAGLTYEVVFISGVLHEINVSLSSVFKGQFAPSAAGGGAAAGSLTVVASVLGVASPAVTIANVPAPASQTAFCDALATDATYTALGGGVAVVTLNSCTFSGNVGTVNGSLAIGGAPHPFAITYTYN